MRIVIPAPVFTGVNSSRNPVLSRPSKVIETPFFLKAGERTEKVTLNLVINGTGTVWVDDIVLSREPLK